MNRFASFALLGVFVASTPSSFGADTATVGQSQLSAPSPGRFAFSLDYKNDVQGKLANRGDAGVGVLGALFLGVEADVGPKLVAQGLFTHGGNSPVIGDAQGVSNIRTPDVRRVYQAYIEQSFAKGRVSLLGGVHDLNTEFYVTESSNLLMNDAFGIGPEFSQSGSAGPSVYAYTAVAGRVRVVPVEKLSVSAAAYDTVDSAFGVGEVSYEIEAGGLAGKAGLGAWAYADTRFGRGAYALLEQELRPELTGFARAGFSLGGDYLITRSVQTGVTYRGAGLGTALAWGTGVQALETVVELTYRAEVLKRVALQPDLQWIANPGLDASKRPIVVAALRAQIQL